MNCDINLDMVAVDWHQSQLECQSVMSRSVSHSDTQAVSDVASTVSCSRLGILKLGRIGSISHDLVVIKHSATNNLLLNCPGAKIDIGVCARRVDIDFGVDGLG